MMKGWRKPTKCACAVYQATPSFYDEAWSLPKEVADPAQCSADSDWDSQMITAKTLD